MRHGEPGTPGRTGQDLLELQRLADDADRLAKDVARLKAAQEAAEDRPPTEEPDPQEQLRAMASDQLRMDHADLSQRLDQLIERRPELLDAAAEHSLDRLSELRDQALRWRLASAGRRIESETNPHRRRTRPIPRSSSNSTACGNSRLMVEQAVQQMLMRPIACRPAGTCRGRHPLGLSGRRDSGGRSQCGRSVGTAVGGAGDSRRRGGAIWQRSAPQVFR
jgi:hypothetical protein